MGKRDRIAGRTVVITALESAVTGLAELGGFLDQTDEAIRTSIEVNFCGVLTGCRLALPQMVRRRSGHIVNVASLAGVMAVPARGVSGHAAVHEHRTDQRDQTGARRGPRAAGRDTRYSAHGPGAGCSAAPAATGCSWISIRRSAGPTRTARNTRRA